MGGELRIKGVDYVVGGVGRYVRRPKCRTRRVCVCVCVCERERERERERESGDTSDMASLSHSSRKAAAWCKLSGLRCRVEGLGFGVWGLGFRV